MEYGRSNAERGSLRVTLIFKINSFQIRTLFKTFQNFTRQVVYIIFIQPINHVSKHITQLTGRTYQVSGETFVILSRSSSTQQCRFCGTIQTVLKKLKYIFSQYTKYKFINSTVMLFKQYKQTTEATFLVYNTNVRCV